MQLKLRKKIVQIIVAIASGVTYVATVHAVPTVISSGLTTARIDDAGYISSYSFAGREFIDHGTRSSNYSLNANGAAVAIADAVTGSNPLGAVILASSASAVIIGNIGLGEGWTFLETVSIPVDGNVAFQIQLTNNTGATATGVQWGVGFDPNQGIPAGLGFSTANTINATGGSIASVSAVSSDGWPITLASMPSAYPVVPYIDPITCCSPVDPSLMLTVAQAAGGYGFANSSINLSYDLGTINARQTVSFGYIISIVPEPETYAMLLAGLGLIGFSAYRRSDINAKFFRTGAGSANQEKRM